MTLVATPEVSAVTPARADGQARLTGLPRLTRSADVTAVLRRGRSRSGGLLAVHTLPHDGSADGSSQAPARPTARLTVVASKRVGGAVRRNRAKRLLREAARPLAWRPGLDVVLVARAACAASDVHAVSAELTRLAVQLDAVDA